MGRGRTRREGGWVDQWLESTEARLAGVGRAGRKGREKRNEQTNEGRKIKKER